MAVDRSRIEAAKEMLRQQRPAQPISSALPDRARIEAAKDMLRQQRGQISQPDANRSGLRFGAEQLGKGALQIADLAHMLGQANPNLMTMPEEEVAELRGPGPSSYPSQYVPEALKQVGIDINQEPEDTSLRRVAGHALRAAPSAVLGPMGRVGQLAKNAAIASGLGAASGTLQEAGMSPLAAEAATLAGGVGAGMGFSKLKPNPQAAVGKYLEESIGKENISKIIKRMEKSAPFGATGYEPMTAEIANNPVISQLHRSAQGRTGSQIPEMAGKNAEKLESAIRKISKDKDLFESGERVRSEIEHGIKELKGERHKATSHLYDRIKKNEEAVSPKHLEDFFKEHGNVAGDLEKDVNSIRKWTKPKEGNTFPTVARLDAAQKAINSRIGKYKRSGEDARAKIMLDGKKAIEKSLEEISDVAEANKLYREKSEPISQITKQKRLKNIIQKDDGHYKLPTNKVVAQIFDENALANVRSLNKSMQNHPKVKENLRHGVAQYFYDSVTNASNVGNAQSLSYPKMKRFLKTKGKALSEVLEPEQMAVIGEFERAVAGQNKASTLGIAPGSPTVEKALTHMKFNQKVLGNKGKSIPFLSSYLDKNSEEAADLLHKFLINPRFAKKVLGGEFKDQSSFNTYATKLSKLRLPSAVQELRKD